MSVLLLLMLHRLLIITSLPFKLHDKDVDRIIKEVIFLLTVYRLIFAAVYSGRFKLLAAADTTIFFGLITN